MSNECNMLRIGLNLLFLRIGVGENDSITPLGIKVTTGIPFKGLS